MILLNNIRKLAKIMGNHAKVNESEAKVTRELDILPLERAVRQLFDRLDRLECKWDALIRRLEGVARHPEDEGWFD